MAGGFAHEIRNALSGATLLVLGYNEAPAQSPEETQALLEEVGAALSRAMRITTMILDYAQIDDLVPGADVCDLKPAVEEALRAVEKNQDLGALSLQLDVAPGAVVRMRDADLRTILLHLLRNACEAAAASGTSGGAVRLDARDVGGAVTLEISDSGAGIPEVVRGRLYEPFATTKGARGVGLGLGITRKLVTLYGGAIDVETSPRGTRFSVTLPR
jgi:signal transduction histidine kinase